jgi:hypothetical protein
VRDLTRPPLTNLQIGFSLVPWNPPGGFGASAAPSFGQTQSTQANTFGRGTTGPGLFGANASATPGGAGFSFGGGGAIDRIILGISAAPSVLTPVVLL